MRNLIFNLLFMSAAFGADLPKPNKQLPLPLSPVSIALKPIAWDGYYIGLHAGPGFAGRFNDMTNPSVIKDGKGVVGGVRVGYDKQNLDWVFGAFAEFNGVSVKSTGTFMGAGQLKGQLNWTASGLFRAGNLITKDLLIYGLFGANFSSFTMDYVNGALSAHEKNAALGWSIGGGAEYKINQAFTVFSEYRNANHIPKTMSNFMNAKYDVNYHAVRLGVNYKY